MVPSGLCYEDIPMYLTHLKPTDSNYHEELERLRGRSAATAISHEVQSKALSIVEKPHKCRGKSRTMNQWLS